ncbi:MAG: hypothetical protein PHX80_03765 [Candidatus Nanoarchaeia archaeon]|nr:hypothetical protein [Candidatus Nanoarchaeia archaeon]
MAKKSLIILFCLLLYSCKTEYREGTYYIIDVKVDKSSPNLIIVQDITTKAGNKLWDNFGAITKNTIVKIKWHERPDDYISAFNKMVDSWEVIK